MKIDQGLGPGLGGVPDAARKAEQAGYDGVWSAETSHDPFLPLLLAAEHTERIELGTSIAVAFARSPMTVATLARDLQDYSGGRFVLGLGSQVRAHISYRFGMPWSHPAARMREFVQALRAIWAAWNGTEPLAFRGEFYRHTLMTPFFDPGPAPHGDPKVFLAAVGAQMTQVAGEVADGLICHAFTTPSYLHQVTIPALERGLRAAGRERADLEVSIPAFIVTGGTEQDLTAAAGRVRQQIAFYASTPTYRPVLEHHGWGELQTELNALVRADRWAELPGLIDDQVLAAFAVIGEPEEIPAGFAARYGGLADRLMLGRPEGVPPDRWAAVVESFRRI